MRAVMAERRRVVCGVASGELDPEATTPATIPLSVHSLFFSPALKWREVRPQWVLAGGSGRTPSST